MKLKERLKSSSKKDLSTTKSPAACIKEGTGFPIQGFPVQNYWVAPRSTQPFILPRSIK